ncbi:hypothetical protein ACH3XW_26780 [Acanthocheilonema viteae]
MWCQSRDGMSSKILYGSAVPTKGKILKLLNEVEEMDWRGIEEHERMMRKDKILEEGRAYQRHSCLQGI